jgi:FkbM family methyltransferase
MINQAISNGAGMEIMDPGFRGPARLAITVLFKIPSHLRDVILFGSSRVCVPLQKVIVRLLGGPHLVETRFTEGPMCGRSFICWSSEKYFFLGSHLEDDVQRLLLKILHSEDVCYDVGGHAGYMSLLFSAIAGPTGRVFTFEPSPVNFPRARRTIEANGLTNVSVLNLAASDHEGDAELEECGTMSAIVVSSNESDNRVSKIRTIRLDDFTYRDGNPPPTFIKLDVEGHAGPALEGARRIFELARPRLMCEIHHSEEQEQVRAFLSSCRYSWSPIDRDHPFPIRVICFPE